ncbi:hypothetical protein ATE71_08965 [Sphingopyxis sp. H115]|nr:hypothetical protein ATE71_08965 [Sphingopyxis sp. H115]
MTASRAARRARAGVPRWPNRARRDPRWRSNGMKFTCHPGVRVKHFAMEGGAAAAAIKRDIINAPFHLG